MLLLYGRPETNLTYRDGRGFAHPPGAPGVPPHEDPDRIVEHQPQRSRRLRRVDPAPARRPRPRGLAGRRPRLVNRSRDGAGQVPLLTTCFMPTESDTRIWMRA